MDMPFGEASPGGPMTRSRGQPGTIRQIPFYGVVARRVAGVVGAVGAVKNARRESPARRGNIGAAVRRRGQRSQNDEVAFVIT